MKHLHDLETFWTAFELSCQDYNTGESWVYFVNEYQDDRLELKKYLRSFDGFSLSFNGYKYDFAVLEYLDQNNYFIGQSWEVFCRETKSFSDQLILGIDEMFVYKYTHHKNFKFIIIDCYLFWAKLLRLSKKLSLKSLAIQLGYPVVQELPYPPDIQYLTKEQIDEIHHYCSVHDLGILKMLITAMEGEINLRNQIVKDYGINAWSMDAPKIANEALLNEYCRVTGHNRKEVSKWKFDKPTIRFGELLKNIPVRFKTEPFISVYNQWMNSIDNFSKDFIIFCKSGHAVKISASVGGIHSVNNNEIYESDNDYVVVTSDLAAMYPTNIRNWNAFRFPELMKVYSGFIESRKNETKPGMKKHQKGTPEFTYYKQKDTFIKLILNSTSGLLDNPHSWLYYPEGIMTVRCGGQLLLMDVMEKCVMAGFDIISANTDGIEVRIHRNRLNEYYDILKECEQRYNVDFESQFYKKIVYSNVNSYIAITDKGEIKQKGEFVTKPELGNSTDMMVVPKALNAYFVEGIRPEEFIYAKDLHIYDFCLSQKCDKSYTVEWNGKKQQRLNRYYVSTKGAYLYKCRDNKKHHMMKGFGVQLYNVHQDKPINQYSINYGYYLKQINDKISEIERHKQLNLFS